MKQLNEIHRLQKLANIKLNEELNENDLIQFNNLATELEKRGVPCELRLVESTFAKFRVLLGFRYPETLLDKVYAAMNNAGLSDSEVGISADEHGYKIIKSKYINGGPKSYFLSMRR